MAVIVASSVRRRDAPREVGEAVGTDLASRRHAVTTTYRDPLTAAARGGRDRAASAAHPLPVAPLAKPGLRHLPLAGASRTVDRQWRPAYVVWEITLACDLACRHCGSRAGRERPDELSTEEALDLARQIADLGAPEVTLIGGEAYLRDDWLEIVRVLADRGVTVSMTTGGRGLTPERARGAKAAGLAGIGVSIDGDEAVHDRLRGVPGSYRAALGALENARAAGLRVACNTQLNRLSVPLLPGIVEVIASHGVHSWQIQLTVPMGRAADEPDVLLQPYELLDLFPLLATLKSRCDELGIRVWTGNNVGYFGPYETVLRGHYPYGRGGQCGAGRASLGIEANGGIKGCPSLPSASYTGGNIRDASLEDIWERSAALRVTRDRTVDDLWGFCRGCYYAEDCMAGCMWTSHVYFGRPGTIRFATIARSSCRARESASAWSERLPRRASRSITVSFESSSKIWRKEHEPPSAELRRLPPAHPDHRARLPVLQDRGARVAKDATAPRLAGPTARQGGHPGDGRRDGRRGRRGGARGVQQRRLDGPGDDRRRGQRRRGIDAGHERPRRRRTRPRERGVGLRRSLSRRRARSSARRRRCLARIWRAARCSARRPDRGDAYGTVSPLDAGDAAPDAEDTGPVVTAGDAYGVAPPEAGPTGD